jgi:hypothetical protein
VKRVAVVALALAFGAQAAQASSTPTLAFGRSGGNIAPFTVTILSAGRVTAHGPVRLARPRLTLTADAVHGLVDLAKAEGFFRMPATTTCRGTLPDFASSFVAVGSTRVSVRGSCNPPLLAAVRRARGGHRREVANGRYASAHGDDGE